MKVWFSRGLLAFIVFTLGYGVGKEVTLRGVARSGGDGPSAGGTVAREEKVIVTYMHTTFRCVTCNSIERMAKDLVESEFGAALRAGRIEWRDVDFQERDDLAKRYDIASSCVVVSHEVGGAEASFQRLDDVWTLWEKPTEFDAYLSGAIRSFLPEGAAAGGDGAGE